MKLALVIVGLLVATAVHAETRRVAIVVGNNSGAGDRPTLHYAEADAQKLALTLAELGGLERANLYLLQGRPVNAVREAFAAVATKVKAWHAANPATHVVLIFFFSGHSDGESLELGGDRLSFTELRQWLASVGAEVRLGIVDSCRSGALLALKGGHPGPAFTIRLSDEVSSTGEALLTSSAADELALESREIGGSFFTHHLVSGLRGAADTSGDGKITLAEAYQYAFQRTVSATASTTIGTQHPGYDYRMSGQGDLVLSDLSHRTAALDLPHGFQRMLVQEDARDQVLAEVPADTASRIALPPGRYTIRAWRDRQTLVAHVNLLAGEVRAIGVDELKASAQTVALAKGGATRRTLGITLVLGGGVDEGFAAGVPVHGAVHLGVRSAAPSGWTTDVLVSTGRGDGFWETTALAMAGYRLGFEHARFRGYAALEGAVGFVAQTIVHRPTLDSPALAGVPELGFSVRLSPALALGAEAQFLVGWFRKDHGNAVLTSPTGWLGILWTL